MGLNTTRTLPPPPSIHWPTEPAIQPIEEALHDNHFEMLHRRRKESLSSKVNRQNSELIGSVVHAASEFGENHLVTFTLTFRGNVEWAAATSALKRARNFLIKEFLGWAWVADFNQSSVIHFHGMAIVPFNAQEGLNRDALEKFRKLEKLGRKTTAEQRQERLALKKEITSNPLLLGLQKRLETKVTEFGFGWKVEVTPILKTPEIAAKYMVKRLAATQRRRQQFSIEARLKSAKAAVAGPQAIRPALPPRAHLFGYAGNFPRVKITEPTAGQLRYRAKFTAIERALGRDDREMRLKYGPRWKFCFGAVIDELDYHYGSDPTKWSVDEVSRCVSQVFPEPETVAEPCPEKNDVGDLFFRDLLESPFTHPVDRRWAAAYFDRKEIEWWQRDLMEEESASRWHERPDSEPWLNYLDPVSTAGGSLPFSTGAR